jgi:hypothetical protein
MTGETIRRHVQNMSADLQFCLLRNNIRIVYMHRRPTVNRVLGDCAKHETNN